MQVDYSPERRAHALAWIRGEGLLTSGVSDDAKLMAAIGLLICNEVGVVKQDDLTAAYGDPSIVQAARNLLAEAAL